MKRLIFACIGMLAACGPRYAGFELTLASDPPVPVQVSIDSIDLAVGIAMAVDAKPLSSNEFDYYLTDPVTLRSQDRDILRIEPTENKRRFVLIGVSPGETCVEIEFDHEERACVPTSVRAGAP